MTDTVPNDPFYREQTRLVREDPEVAAANDALERAFGKSGEEAANARFNKVLNEAMRRDRRDR